jgi:hypothetical protein
MVIKVYNDGRNWIIDRSGCDFVLIYYDDINEWLKTSKLFFSV